jgi:hypothetical protein
MATQNYAVFIVFMNYIPSCLCLLDWIIQIIEKMNIPGSGTTGSWSTIAFYCRQVIPPKFYIYSENSLLGTPCIYRWQNILQSRQNPLEGTVSFQHK